MLEKVCGPKSGLRLSVYLYDDADDDDADDDDEDVMYHNRDHNYHHPQNSSLHFDLFFFLFQR